MEEIFSLYRECVSKHGTECTELEVRFRSVSKRQYLRIKEQLSRFEEQSFKEIKASEPGNKVYYHRLREYDSETVTQSKTKIFKKVLHDKWISVVLSLELEINSSTLLHSQRKIERRRTSASIDDGRATLEITQSDNDFQVELEIHNTEWDFLSFVDEVNMAMNDSPLPLRRSMSDTVKNIVHKDYERVNISKRLYQVPVTMMSDFFSRSLFCGDLYATPKMDGERRFLVIFNGEVYSVDLLEQVRYEDISCAYDSSSPSILDCEYVRGEYWIIDVVVFDGKYSSDRRAEVFPEFLRKPRVEVPRSCADLEKVYSSWKQSYEMDGMIVTSREYMGPSYKLKEFNTVDLKVTQDNSLETHQGDVVIANHEEKLTPGEIYEFKVLGPKTLQKYRHRADKPRPNSSKVVENNMSDACVTSRCLFGEKALMMRKLHNEEKRKLYSCNKGDVIIDVGTGQGGDFAKWGEAAKVYSIDASHEQFFKRIPEKSRKKVMTISERMRKYDAFSSKINLKADIVSMFFCLNLFEDADLEKLYEMISRKTKTSAKIIGSYFSPLEERSNECYAVSFMEGDAYRIRIEGTRIDQVERRFDFKKFESRLHDMKLKTAKHFSACNASMSKNEISLSSQFHFFSFVKQ